MKHFGIVNMLSRNDEQGEISKTISCSPRCSGIVSILSGKKPVMEDSRLKLKKSLLKMEDKLATSSSDENFDYSICGNKGKLYEGDKLLKPLRPGFSDNERNFYENMPEHLRPFTPKYLGMENREGQSYIVLQNMLKGYRNPGMMDIKCGLTTDANANLERDSVANLLGCYCHGVKANKIVYKNHVNAYEGKMCSVEYFDKIVQKFFKKMAEKEREENCTNLVNRLFNLVNVVREMKGARFESCSIFFVYEQDQNVENPLEPNVYMIDFERARYINTDTGDEAVIRAMCHVLYSLRKEAYRGKPISTVYLVRHAERYDYTDMEWAPKNAHPHDSPLSPVGDTQAQDIADRLAHTHPHLIISSPFQRAILTAEPIARRLKMNICVEPGITEFMCNRTRKQVPNFISEAVSVSPWVDTDYEPFWPDLQLETWDEMYERVASTLQHLVNTCRGKGDLIIVSHRSTLQNLIAELAPKYTGDRKLEYGGIAMIVEGVDGEMEVQTFNEVAHLRNLIASPSSNPYRHIEGYYRDMDWGNYRSSATR